MHLNEKSAIQAVENEELLFYDGKFKIVNLLVETYHRILAHVVEQNIHMNEPNRAAVGEELKDDIIPMLKVLIQNHASNNPIDNALRSSLNHALVAAQQMLTICSTGRFPKNWDTRKKMFTEQAQVFKADLGSLRETLVSQAHFKGDVSKEMARLYYGPFSKKVDHLSARAD